MFVYDGFLHGRRVLKSCEEKGVSENIHTHTLELDTKSQWNVFIFTLFFHRRSPDFIFRSVHGKFSAFCICKKVLLYYANYLPTWRLIFFLILYSLVCLLLRRWWWRFAYQVLCHMNYYYKMALITSIYLLFSSSYFFPLHSFTTHAALAYVVINICTHYSGKK